MPFKNHLESYEDLITPYEETRNLTHESRI